jgi:hypothetical protein
VSRPYATDEQYERWFIAECCRCGRRKHKAGSWPDGHVCRTCADRAVRARGICPGCGQDRALPGIRPGDGAATCATCAGFSQSFACSRCGIEGKLLAGRRCERCTLAGLLTLLLDDGTGRIRPELSPLFGLLMTMERPGSGLAWLDMRRGQPGNAREMLRQLGLGQITLTHDAFHELQPWRAAAHMEELLMASGVLPALDRQICSFQRWLPGHLGTITDPGHVKTIRRYATWAVLAHLRARADRAPITPSIRRLAGEQVRHATGFLTWLAGRDRALATCQQADIDAWHAERSKHDRACLRPFLTWSAQTRLIRHLNIPAQQISRGTQLTEDQRLDLLGRVLSDPAPALQVRAAAVIVLLYAQPLTRVVQLTLDHVLRDGDNMLLQLGEPPSPVPGPAASLLLEHIANRDNMNTATNRDSRWLFPGRRAGQPCRPDHLAARLNEIGIPVAAARGAAIRQQLLEMPAPVVADALSYHHVTATRLAAQAGATWSRYASGDHLHPPAGWNPQETGGSRLREPASMARTRRASTGRSRQAVGMSRTTGRPSRPSHDQLFGGRSQQR